MRRLAAFALLCAAGPACSPGAFDDRRDRAWSDSTGAPAGLPAGDYGVAVAASAAGTGGLTFVVLGDPPSLTTVSYDRDGNLSRAGIALTGITFGDAVPTLAAAPEAVSGADRLVAVGGVPSSDVIFLFDARSGADGPTPVGTISASGCGAAVPGLGQHMVFGYTDLGDWDTPDLVVVTGSELVIFPISTPAPAPRTACAAR